MTSGQTGEQYRAPDQKCSQTGCENTYRDHRWGASGAHQEGWFLQQNGDSWCPEHVPDWVEAWRARRGKRAKKED